MTKPKDNRKLLKDWTKEDWEHYELEQALVKIVRFVEKYVKMSIKDVRSDISDLRDRVTEVEEEVGL